MFITFKNGECMVAVDQIKKVMLVKDGTLGLLMLKDEKEPIFFPYQEFDMVKTSIRQTLQLQSLMQHSNDLKETKQIQPRVTTRRGRQHERNYHKPAQIPQNHVFSEPKSWDGLGEYPLCVTCLLPQTHPCHNASNPIEENSDANRLDETPTN